MELLDIADEYGNLTGEVMEREKAHDLNKLHWEVSIFIINKKKQVLLEKRAPDKRYSPNKWGLCSGHVQSGETIEEAALREIFEEIGLQISKDNLHILDKMIVTKRDFNSQIVRVYYAICDENKFKIQQEELTAIKWFDISKIIDMINNHDDSITLGSARLKYLEYLEALNL